MVRERKPAWIKARFPGGERFMEVKRLLREEGLHSVCEEARCPNIGECFNAGTATFMILGDVCTRACGFCDVTSGRPGALDLLEPLRLASTVERLGLDYAVITSVNRDDVPDGGASIFAGCLRAIRHRAPGVQVEVLIPDFEGNWDALRTVVEAGPVVLNHNTETVPRLYRRVRPKGVYTRSLELLRRVKEIDPAMTTKSGVMVGLGETFEEVVQTMADLREHGCDLLTVGQYLRPSAEAPASRALLAPRRVRRPHRRGRTPRLPARGGRPARALLVPRGRAEPGGEGNDQRRTVNSVPRP